jgi:hypothetical protein
VSQIVFAPAVPRVFADVVPIHPFALEAGEVDFSPWIQRLYASGITTGCGTNPLRYCPDAVVTRAQMAVFLVRGILGAGYTPPPANGGFGDVDLSDAFAPWIEALADAGITGGCGNGNYCPDAVVTRAQMAVFLMRAMHGRSYTPQAATGTRFSDVPAGDMFAPWIEALADSGITSGCGGGKYCPDAAVTRAQMAVFLVRAFGL